MPKIKLSQDDVDNSSNVYNEGWFLLQFEELTQKKAGDGSELYVYSGKIIDADEDNNKKYINRKFFINVSEKGFGFAIPMFRAAGAQIPEKIGPEGIDIEMNFMLKKKLKAHNAPKNDKNGTLRNNWDSFVAV